MAGEFHNFSQWPVICSHFKKDILTPVHYTYSQMFNLIYILGYFTGHSLARLQISFCYSV